MVILLELTFKRNEMDHILPRQTQHSLQQ